MKYPDVDETWNGNDMSEQEGGQQLINKFEVQGLYDYLPNRLTQPEIQTLTTRIDSELVLTDGGRKSHLLELRNYIIKNGSIFPEFSHGTSSDALVGILKHGLHPRESAINLHDKDTQNIGEGGRGNLGRSLPRGTSKEIYMGIGQGGLGTTRAYATKLIDDPRWNYNLLTIEDIQRLQSECQEAMSIVGMEDMAAKIILEDRVSALQRALMRKQRGIPQDFPIVLGVALDVDPRDSSLRFLTDYRGGKKYLNRRFGFDSEVAVAADPPRSPETLKIIATDLKDKSNIKTILKENGREDVQIITFGALGFLRESGYPRVSDSYGKALAVLDNIMDSNDVHIKNVVDRINKGIPSFEID